MRVSSGAIVQRIARIPFAALAVLLLLTLTLPACSATRDLLESLDRPTARITDAHLTDLTAEGATIGLDVEITNPYSVALPVAAIDLALSSGGTPFLTTASEPGGVIPAGQSASMRVPATVNFMHTLTVLQGVRPGSVLPYRADLGIGVDLPGGQRLSIPLAHEGQVPIPVPPAIAFQGLRWDELTLQRARGVLSLEISNPNEFAATLRSLDYALLLGGQRVAEATLADMAQLLPGGSGVVEIPLSFSTVSLGTTVFQAISTGQVQIGLSGDANLGTPFGDVRLPVNASGRAPVER